MSYFFENLDASRVKHSLIFLDVDGTLLSDNQTCLSSEVKKQISALAKHNHLWLCTNSFNHRRNEFIEKEVRIPLIQGHRKPSVKILEYISEKEKKLPIVVIGDKVLTDGLFAWRIDAQFIKVKRKTSNDRWFVRIYNIADDIMCNLFKLLRIFY